MSDLDETLALLVAARAERSPKRSRELFDLSLRSCDSDANGDGVATSILKAQILGEIAYEEGKAEDRTRRWLQAIGILEKHWKLSPNLGIADAHASLAVDCFQDVFSTIEFAPRLKILRNARDYLDYSMKQLCNSEQAKATLLTRKSSVLRHLSLGDQTPEARSRRSDESVGCARRAVQLFRYPGSILELAQAEWQRARYEPTDEQYVSRLRSAEIEFNDAVLKEDEIAQLALSRFYRLTFRQRDACATYPRLKEKLKNTRRLLRESYIYAEASLQLAYSRYPQDIVRHHLTEARVLLESAISAGYQNARLISDLAFVMATLDGAAAGSAALADICTASGSVSWEEALRLVAEADVATPATLGLALGIDQSPVWTILGTFVRRFLKDDELTELFYRTALRLDAHNVVALTNLARFLIQTKGSESLREAQRLIQRAQSFSDRRFTWWRAVQAMLTEKQAAVKPGIKIQVGGRDRIRPAPPHFVNQRQLRDRFREVQGLSNAQQRGYELELLVYEMAKLTFDTAVPPYRIERTGGDISQIDGFFIHKSDKYRVECKWTSATVDHNDVVIFKDKLDVIGVSGLLISMSGFTPSAVNRTKEYKDTKAILLMDGDEVRYVFGGQMNFDEVMRRKRAHFDQLSEPYFRVVPISHAA
jgi:hypothetical protein